MVVAITALFLFLQTIEGAVGWSALEGLPGIGPVDTVVTIVI